MAEHLPDICETLGSIPSMDKEKRKESKHLPILRVSHQPLNQSLWMQSRNGNYVIVVCLCMPCMCGCVCMPVCARISHVDVCACIVCVNVDTRVDNLGCQSLLSTLFGAGAVILLFLGQTSQLAL